MADLIIKGKTFNKIDHQLAQILLQMFPDDVQKLQPPRSLNLGQGDAAPVRERKPVWSVGFQPRNGRAVLNLLTPLGEHIPFQGKPGDAQPVFTKMGWPVPQQFLDDYAAAFNRQPETVWRDAKPEDHVMGLHYRRDLFDSTPPPARPPLDENNRPLR